MAAATLCKNWLTGPINLVSLIWTVPSLLGRQVRIFITRRDRQLLSVKSERRESNTQATSSLIGGTRSPSEAFSGWCSTGQAWSPISAHLTFRGTLAADELIEMFILPPHYAESIRFATTLSVLCSRVRHICVLINIELEQHSIWQLVQVHCCTGVLLTLSIEPNYASAHTLASV